MIKIYGSMMSSASRCYWMAEECGLQLENVPLDFTKQEQKSAEYLALNPNGKVPTIVDGEFVLWESMAINMYFAEKQKPELLGATPEDRAHVNQWSYWGIAHMSHAAEPLLLQKFRSTPDNDETMKAKEGLAKLLPILDNALAGKNYLVADTFTAADLNLASIMGGLMWAGADLSAYTNIGRWMGMLAQRPAFQKTIGKK